MFHGTTILCVRRDGRVVLAGDGQVTLDKTVLKGTAKKVRRLADGQVIAGFAGSTSDAFTLFERFEAKLKEHGKNLARACVELGKDWRTDRYLRKLEALLVVADKEKTFILSGSGDVVEPDFGAAAVGSGGSYALAAARALLQHSSLPAKEIAQASMAIAADICIYTNTHLSFEELDVPAPEPLRKMQGLTPREIVSALDRYIVGQDKAKRAVAIALRNRWRRQQVLDDLREEIYPKNIILIGPTGVGKTEIARRLARLAQAPFVKVEASKFTEVGYVGRDVESMIRDLVEAAIALVREEETEKVKERAAELAEDRLAELLHGGRASPGVGFTSQASASNLSDSEREKLRAQIRAGTLDDQYVEIDVADNGMTFLRNFSGQGMEEIGLNMQDMFKNLPGYNRTRKKKAKVPDALKLLAQEEAQKLVDQDRVVRDAILRAELSGIVFIDEIDKIASREGSHSVGPDVSREGVQRDILPVVEGSTITTKYGPVKTDHMLFIAAGAFHVSKPSDLIPELQGRFPIRVELEPLTGADLVRILKEPKNSLLKQYTALLATEGVRLHFADDAVAEIARMAQSVNERSQNIGARRLHTVMEKLLDDVSFNASEMAGKDVAVDAAYVRERLQDIIKDEDLSRYIL